MLTYELVLLFKKLPKGDLSSAIKRAASSIFEQGGIIRRIDNLGFRKTPYKISNHGDVHKEANYLLLTFTSPPSSISTLESEYGRDVDIIRSRIYKTTADDVFECTLDEELKPAPYRPEVIKMLDLAKKKAEKRKVFNSNTGLDYYPFQK